MIVVEGCDGAGKTTLVNRLCEHYDIPVGERGVKDRSRLWESTRRDTRRALGYAVVGSRMFIWDRLFYSDFVYAPITGRKVAFPTFERNLIQGVIDALRCPVILCHPDLETVTTNAQKDDQMDGVLDNIASIWEGYEEFRFDNLGGVRVPHNFLVYDYTRDINNQAWNQLVGRIDAYIGVRKERDPWRTKS